MAKGSLKKQALESEDTKIHQLTEWEMNYTRLLNMALQYNTMGQRIISGYLHYVCKTRLGYADNLDLQFEIDLDKTDNLLTVTLLPSPATTP